MLTLSFRLPPLPPSEERFYSKLDTLRDEIVSEVLYASSVRIERTLGADLFLDVLFDQFVRAATEGSAADWLRASALRLGQDELHEWQTRLAREFLRVLEAVLEEHLAPERLRVAVRRVTRSLGSRLTREMEARESAGATVFDETDAILNRLVSTLGATDPVSAEHSRAVASWCARLGRRLRLAEDEITLVTRAGLVHDIGKLKVPLEVLNAPRRLSADEWRLMAAHVTIGEDLARVHDELNELLPAVRNHHERLDGDGYPDGLKRSRIPLVARIVTVADCFNAMIGRRPYRAPILPSLALEELERSAGSQLDPDITEAMLDVVSRHAG